MDKANIKIIRILVSCTMLSLFFLSFLGEEKISGLLSETLLIFQFIPSLIRFVLTPEVILGFGFIVILLLSLVFGRVYCSFICPLGMLQDLFIFISRKTGLRKRHVFQSPMHGIQYFLLGISVVSAIFGTLSIVNVLDPYSLFGKIAAHLFKSAALFANNMLANLFEMSDIYLLHIKKQHEIPDSILFFTVFFLCILLLFSIFRGRMYCNSICPVGGILGLVSRVSFFQFAIDGKKCKACRVCEHVCKTGCIDIKRKTIDNSRCVACFNCLGVCAESAVTYSFHMPEQGKQRVQPRRMFMVSIAATACTLLSTGFPVRMIWGRKTETMPITPPGSLSITHFTKTCIGCHLCVSVCPTNVITPVLADYGMFGLMQPKMDYLKGHCDFGCNACGIVCPTGAISQLTPGEKKQVRIGTVILDKEKCIVHVKKRHCGACGEACPTYAISPVQKGRVLFPEINADYCIGCGACEHACPALPKAIFVKAEPVHGKALKYIPDERIFELPASSDEKFPF